VPDDISKGFNKKRIDHRHHALDALVIACCTRKHTQYLNALNAEKKNYGLRDTLLIKSKEGHYTKHFLQPWANFIVDAKDVLETTVVSFKQNLRVINKTNNKTWQWVKKDGVSKKVLVKQTKGDNWAIRKSMHQASVSGKVTLLREHKTPINFTIALKNWQLIVDRSIKKKVKTAFKLFDNDLKKVKKHFKENPITVDDTIITKVTVFDYIEATASRATLTEKFTRKKLESITDLGIQKILENHLKNYISAEGKEQFDLAFSPVGIQALNKNIINLNDGKKHQPIYKVRLYEVGNKFSVSDDKESAKHTKYVEAAKGTNLFFAVYWDAKKEKRVFDTIPLNEVIEHQKWRATIKDKEERNKTPMIPTISVKGRFMFSLSPNDLVYVPIDEEVNDNSLVDFSNLNKEQVQRIYTMEKTSGVECYFTRNDISTLIKKYDAKSKFGELGSQNKYQTTMCVETFKISDRCWKLKANRLGTIVQVVK
jgi:CRISPR-associated endonuclease Csn1